MPRDTSWSEDEANFDFINDLGLERGRPKPFSAKSRRPRRSRVGRLPISTRQAGTISVEASQSKKPIIVSPRNSVVQFAANPENDSVFYRPTMLQSTREDYPRRVQRTRIRRAGTTATAPAKATLEPEYYLTPDIKNSGNIRIASPAAHQQVHGFNSLTHLTNQSFQAGANVYPYAQIAPTLPQGKIHFINNKWIEVIPQKVDVNFKPYGIKYAFPVADVTQQGVDDNFMASPKVKNKNSKPSFARFLSNQDLLSELIDKPYKYGLSDDDALKEMLGISRKPKISDRLKQVASRIEQNVQRARASRQSRRAASLVTNELPEDMQSSVFQPIRRIRPVIQEEKASWRGIRSKAKQLKNTAGLANKIDLGARIIEDIGKTHASNLIRKPAQMATNQWNKLPRKAKIGIGVGAALYLLYKGAKAADSLFVNAPRAQTNDTKRGMMQKRHSVSQLKKNNKYFR